MRQERETERAQVAARNRALQEAAIQKRESIESVNKRLCSLFSMDDKPQERGKLLEATLNDLFKSYGILIIEDFRRKVPDSALVLKQIDGVIVLKWLKDPVGVVEIGPHLVRLYGRAKMLVVFLFLIVITRKRQSSNVVKLLIRGQYFCLLYRK